KAAVGFHGRVFGPTTFEVAEAGHPEDVDITPVGHASVMKGMRSPSAGDWGRRSQERGAGGDVILQVVGNIYTMDADEFVRRVSPALRRAAKRDGLIRGG